LAPWIQADDFPISIPADFTSLEAEETFAFGKRLASLLKKGSIVALTGPLGAGKTCFVKGIASGLGIKEVVTSATYTIISEYEAFVAVNTGCEKIESIPFYHIDAYRLEKIDDFTAIGGEDIIFGNGISVIEWGDRISGIIPNGAIWVDIEIKKDGKRSIRIQ